MRFSVIFLVGCLLLAATGTARGQSARSAISYGKSIAGMQLRLLKKNLRYIVRSSRNEPTDKAEARRLILVAETEAIRNELQRGAAYNGNSELRATTLRVCEAMLAAYANDYRQLNELGQGRISHFDTMQRYSKAHDAAQQKMVVLADSLLAAQERFADLFGGNPTNYAELRRWADATQLVKELYQYNFQVFLPYFRVQMAFEPLLAAFAAHDAAGVEAARVGLAAAAAQSDAELDAVPEFKNLEVAYRDATREFVKLQTTACTYHLVEIAGLMKRQDQLSAGEVNTINTYLAAYNAENQKLTQTISRTGDALMRTYSAKINEELAK